MMRVGAIIIAVVLGLLAGSNSFGQDEKPSEYQVKAAFLYNFANFVTWPAEAFSDSAAPLTIGILGPNPFGEALEQIVDGEYVDGRAIVVVQSDTVAELMTCQMLYVSLTDRQQLDRLLKRLEGKSILTVGEDAGFAERGGVIGFVSGEKRVQFEVNMSVADEVGLKISSRLQKVARALYRD